MANEMNENEDIRQLLKGDGDTTFDQRRTRLTLSRARRQIGQRDTFAFALVKIWAVLARLVALFFATVAEKQAEMIKNQASASSETNSNTTI